LPVRVFASPHELAGRGGSGSGDRVLRVALAAPASTLPVRAINLHDGDVVGVEEPGEPGTVGTGAFDSDELDVTEAPQPAEQSRVTSRGRVEHLDTTQTTAFVERGGNVNIEVCVDTTGDS
jgi:hypothetical protein